MEEENEQEKDENTEETYLGWTDEQGGDNKESEGECISALPSIGMNDPPSDADTETDVAGICTAVKMFEDHK